MIDENNIGLIRSICQHRINVHPMWDEEGTEVMRVFFGLDDEELAAFNALLNWIASHGLEQFLRQKAEIAELKERLYGV